jgi:acyl carrier protein
MAFTKTVKSPVASQLSDSIREFILKQFPIARKRQVKNSDALLEEGILDSMGVLEVVAFIEREFATVVSDDDLMPENFRSIDQIADFVRRRVKV